MLRNLPATFFRRLSARGRQFWHIRYQIGFTLLTCPLYSILISLIRDSQQSWISASIPVFDIRVAFLSSLFILCAFIFYLFFFKNARNPLTFMILCVVAQLIYYLMAIVFWMVTTAILPTASNGRIMGLTLIEHGLFMTAGIACAIAAVEDLVPLMRAKYKNLSKHLNG